MGSRGGGGINAEMQATQLAELQARNAQAQSEIDALRTATPVESDATKAAAKEASDNAKILERNRKGRGSTLLTGGDGLADANTGQAPGLKQLLG